MSLYEEQLEEQNEQLKHQLALVEQQLLNTKRKRIVIVHEDPRNLIDTKVSGTTGLGKIAFFADIILVHERGPFGGTYKTVKDRWNEEGKSYTLGEVEQMYV